MQAERGSEAISRGTVAVKAPAYYYRTTGVGTAITPREQEYKTENLRPEVDR